MKQFFLRGLAEGLAGQSSVQASSIDDVFLQLPALSMVRGKLTISSDTISGFCACDG